MIQPNKIPEAFANSGDKNTIPDVATEQGQASWSEGFPQITQVPVSEGGVAPTREDFNGIFNALSAHVAFAQTGDTYEWDDSTNYAVGARVKGSDGNLYEAVAVSGPSETVGAVSPVTEGQDVWVVANMSEYATKAQDSAKLPLSGGTMTGELKNYTSYNPFNAVVKNRTVTSGAYCDVFRVYSEDESAILSRPRFSYDGNLLGCDWTFNNGSEMSTLKLRSNGNFYWNDKTIECAEESSIATNNSILRLSDGTQIAWGDFNVTANQVVTNPSITAAFRPYQGSGTQTFSKPFLTGTYPKGIANIGDSAVWWVAQANAITATSITVSIGGDQNTSKIVRYIVIGRWK